VIIPKSNFLLSLPTFHRTPILAAYATQTTPFQKGEAKSARQRNTLVY
jgi:hypothetical protein